MTIDYYRFWIVMNSIYHEVGIHALTCIYFIYNTYYYTEVFDPSF